MANSQPQASSENVFELEETVKLWDEDYYHPVAVKYYDEAVANMLRTMSAQQGSPVLDAGCGPGVHSIRAAKYGCKVTAIDLSKQMLSHARLRAKQAGVDSKISFQQDDLTKLSLSEPFPFVFSWGVIIHVPDTEAALDNLARIVAPGGKLALQVANKRSLDFLLERFERWILRKPFDRVVETPLGFGRGDEKERISPDLLPRGRVHRVPVAHVRIPTQDAPTFQPHRLPHEVPGAPVLHADPDLRAGEVIQRRLTLCGIGDFRMGV